MPSPPYDGDGFFLCPLLGVIGVVHDPLPPSRGAYFLSVCRSFAPSILGSLSLPPFVSIICRSGYDDVEIQFAEGFSL